MIVSQDAANAPYVQMELSLALSHLKRQGDYNPRVFGIATSSGTKLPNVPLRYPDDWGKPPVDWRLTEETFEFNLVNTPGVDSDDDENIENIITWMTPKVKFFGREIVAVEELFELEAFDTYKKLFPNPVERDSEHDICLWLNSEVTASKGRDFPRWLLFSWRTLLRRMKGGDDWGSVLGVFEVGGVAVGFVYLSVHLSSGWIFGNYFGMLECWRPFGRASLFLDEIERFVSEKFSNARAIVFEVEVFNNDVISSISTKIKQDIEFDEVELDQIRAIKRVGLYLSTGKSYLLVGSQSKEPVTYRQPAMSMPDSEDEDLSEWLSKKEWPLWLMVRPIGRKGKVQYRLYEILDFVYIELFGNAYDTILKKKGFSYIDYLISLRSEMLSCNDSIVEGSQNIPMNGKKIWEQLIQHRISIPL